MWQYLGATSLDSLPFSSALPLDPHRNEPPAEPLIPPHSLFKPTALDNITQATIPQRPALPASHASFF